MPETISTIFRYSWQYTAIQQTSEEVLWSRSGVSKDYVKLFMEMCKVAGIRSKKITGLVRSHDFR